MARLPNEYQQVEYLQSSGTQYIDTNCKMTPSTEFSLKFYDNNTNDIRFIGTGYCSNDFMLARKLGGSGINYIPCRNAGTWYDKYTQILNNPGINTVELKKEASLRKLYVNGIFDKSFNISSGNSQNNVSIFKPTTDASPSSYGGIRIYYCKLYENSVLVRDLVSCYRKSDNVAGMYDLVNNVFYINQGTGTFIVGPNVKEEVETYTECYVIPNPVAHDLPSNYQEVEYLQNDLNAYLNINIAFNDITKIILDWKSSTSDKSDVLISGPLSNPYIGYTSSSGEGYIIGSGTLSNLNINPQIIYTDKITRHQIEITYSTTNTNNICIGSSYYSSSYNKERQYYNLKLYNGDTLVRDLIPCYRISDNVAGMYDIVNNQFYTNSGTGEFIVGPDVPKHIEQEVYTEILVVENSEAHDLPSAYQEVEYLESTGTQYIDTGYKITTTNYNKLKMNVTLNIIQAGATGWPVIGVGGGNPSWYVGFDSSNVVYYGNIVSDVSTSYTAYRNTFYNYDLDYKELKFTLSNELGTTLVEKNITAVGTPISSDYSMALFGAKQINGSMRCHHMVIKSYQLSDNDVLVRNLIPCYRKSDSVAGMYDLVNNVFYTNSGTGTFAVGPNIDKYTEYEAYTECYIVE